MVFLRSATLSGLSRPSSRTTLRSSSTLSLTTDSSSLYTTTSSRSIYGIGSTAGKAIHALGKSVLRGYESFTIGLRLSVIEVRFSAVSTLNAPLSDGERKVLELMYVDLLELSRAELYDRIPQQRALKILLKQIGSFDVYILVSVMASLVETQPDELRSIITELLFVHRLDWNLQLRDYKGRVSPPHRFTAMDKYNQAWAPQKHALLVCLLNQLISVSPAACEIALEAGLLDALDVVLSRRGFRSDVIYSDDMDMAVDMRTRFLNACAASFVAITAYSEHRNVFFSHSIRRLWQAVVITKQNINVATEPYGRIATRGRIRSPWGTIALSLYLYCQISLDNPLHVLEVDFVSRMMGSVQKVFIKERLVFPRRYGSTSASIPRIPRVVPSTSGEVSQV
ncbi:hypothetical protein HGRIS_010340 [Hohenbuehelia grisea]|uniref:Uncharacterized protein n=1 Tax=Hohenbuehelia grisea TaxID=104357 RepID=A0ABR3J410_9AGAR